MAGDRLATIRGPLSISHSPSSPSLSLSLSLSFPYLFLSLSFPFLSLSLSLPFSFSLRLSPSISLLVPLFLSLVLSFILPPSPTKRSIDQSMNHEPTEKITPNIRDDTHSPISIKNSQRNQKTLATNNYGTTELEFMVFAEAALQQLLARVLLPRFHC